MYIERVFEKAGNKINFAIDYPDGFDKTKQYPVIVYLHGYGFVKSDMEGLKVHCPLQRAHIPDGLPFILIAPHCTDTSWLFRFETLCAFFEYVSALPYCDSARLYLSGSSMGAYSAWMTLLAQKQLFAASVICCGGGPYWAAQFYTDLPIRLVHGEKDMTVLSRESEIMADRINSIGGKVELVIHKELAHDVWTVTFTDPETYRWLYSYKK